MRDSKSLLWEIPNHCYERLSISIIHPPSIFTVGMIWRRILSTFPFSTVLFGWQTSTVHLYSSRLRRRYRRSILTALMRPSLFTLDSIITRDSKSLLREIPNHCYERFQIIVMRDYTSMLREITLQHYERLPFSISIIHPPSIFTVGMIWRRILSTFPFSTLLFGWQTSSVHLYSPRLRRRYRRSILTALMRPSFFYVRFHHYERFQIIVMRDSLSSLREIPNQCYERLHFNVTRVSL